MLPTLTVNPEPRIREFCDTWGNRDLLREEKRVLIIPKGKSREVMYYAGFLADDLARRNICVLSGTDTPAWREIVTSTVRHASPCIMFSSRPLQSSGNLMIQPVAQARVWDCYMDKDLHFYIRGAGILTPARQLATHVIEVPDFIAPDFNPSAFIAGHFGEVK